MAKLYAEQDEGFLPVFMTLPSENIEKFNDEKKGEQLEKQEAHEKER